MGVTREFYAARGDGKKLYRNYSDSGKMILQNETEFLFAEAIDIENAPYTYSEANIDVTSEMMGDEISNEEAYRIIMGVSE